MSCCAIATCKNYGRKTKKLGLSVIYHVFPKDEDIRKEWLIKCKRQDQFNYKNSYVCSEHFLESDYEDDLRNRLLGLPQRKTLKKHAIPSLKLPNEKPLEVGVLNRSTRVINRSIRSNAIKRLKEISPKKETQNDSLNSVNISQHASVSDEVLPTQINDKPPCNQCTAYITTIDSLSEEIVLLKRQIENLKRESQVVKKNTLRRFKRNIKQSQRYQTTIKKLKKMLSNLKLKNKGQQAVSQWIGKLLTPTQIKCIESNKQIRWTNTDISRCVMIRALSPKAYDFWRENFQFPLPSATTLRRWCAKFTCYPGILSNVLRLMKIHFENCSTSNTNDKLCVINFDEMHIDNRMIYDVGMDQILGPHSKVQVVLLRGLVTKWKQPVFFDFDVGISISLLNEIICSVEDAGLFVTSIVSDLGGSNYLSLWSSLKISEQNSCFNHPVDPTRKVYVFADMPHYLKLLRNHFLDSGIELQNGTVVDVNILNEVLEKDNGEIKLCYKLNPVYLTLRGNDRQKVGPAQAVFSRTTAYAIDVLTGNKEAAQFFELIDSFSDIMNSSLPIPPSSHPLKGGFGHPETFEKQKDILNKVTEVVSGMRVKGKKVLLPFQKGILVSIKSLLGLLEFLQCKFSIKYILTTRLTQDALESLFGQLRGLGHFYDHPTPSEVISRLRKLMISNKMPMPSKKSNVVLPEDAHKCTPAYLTAEVLEDAFSPKEMDEITGSPFDEKSYPSSGMLTYVFSLKKIITVIMLKIFFDVFKSCKLLLKPKSSVFCNIIRQFFMV